MKIHTATYWEFTIYYFSKTEECWKMPMVWLRYIKKKDVYYLSSISLSFLNGFVPEKIGMEFKDPSVAFAWLKSLTEKANSLDDKQKKKYCLTNKAGKDYQGNSLTKINEVHRYLQRYTASNASTHNLNVA